MSAYVPPQLDATAFNCPHCGAFAHQEFSNLIRSAYGYSAIPNANGVFKCSVCMQCGRAAIWRMQSLLFPRVSTAPMPNADLPQEILEDYEEARGILEMSPRGAAALLRLAIQKLCKHLGQPGKDINTDIKSLVAAGLPVRVQQSLDVVRVIGNEAVHPGVIDLKDDVHTAATLFALVNFIVEKMISEPKHIDAIYNQLPANKLAGIQDRDK